MKLLCLSQSGNTIYLILWLSFLVVLTVDDELEYWKTIAADSKTRKQTEMSESFISILQPLAEEIRCVH